MYGFYRTFIGCLCLLTLLVTNIGTLKAREYDPIINFDKVWEYSLFNNTRTQEKRLHIASYMKFSEQPFLINGKEYYRFFEFERVVWEYPDYNYINPYIVGKYGDPGDGFLMREDGPRLYFLINRKGIGEFNHIGQFEFEDGQLKDTELYDYSDFEEVMLYDFSLDGESQYEILPYERELYIYKTSEEKIYGHLRNFQYSWPAIIVEGVGPATIGVLFNPFVDQSLMKMLNSRKKSYTFYDHSGDCFLQRVSLQSTDEPIFGEPLNFEEREIAKAANPDLTMGKRLELSDKFLEINFEADWSLEVYRATDGIKAFSQSGCGSTSIDCEAWGKGTYIAICTSHSTKQMLKISI